MIGAIVATAGMTLAAVPLVAVAATTRPVTIEVVLANQDSSAALAGAFVTLRAQPSGVEVDSNSTGLDGRVAFDIDPDASSQYSAHVQWPGGDDALLSGNMEFRSADADVVTVTINHDYRFVSGRITATVGDTPVSDLTGGAAVLSRGGVTLQTIPLSSDGSFTTRAVPTDSAEQYRVSFSPPSGYVLVDAQVNPAFSIPADAGGATTLDVSRQFAVTSTSTPGPSPSPTPDPAPGAPSVVLPGATGMGEALNGISEGDLQSLLDAAGQAGQGNTVPITNSAGQVLGLASTPQAPAQQALMGMVGSMNAALPGVSVQGISLSSMDLETALMMVQSQRTTLLDAQLATQIQEVQARNAQIGLLNSALGAVQGFVASPTTERFTAATAAARAAGVTTDPFLAATAGTAAPLAPAFIAKLKGMIDAAGNSQQMDMLRLQSMSNKRNEAFDTMTNFVKKMQESRSSIIGNMRSKPVAIGTVRWDNGVVTRGFNLTGVPNGRHHLILTLADAGVTIIAEVDVRRGMLPATGGQMGPTLGIGIGLLALGVVAVVGAPILRRRDQVTNAS